MTDIFTKETRNFHENGKLAFESFHVGPLVVINEWHKNGTKMREYVKRLSDLTFVGIYRAYSPCGRIWDETRYNEDGNIVYEKRYMDDELQSEVLYENAEVIEKIAYRHGKIASRSNYTNNRMVQSIQYYL